VQYITTPEQEQFRQTIRKLAEEKVAPRSAEIDRTGECPWDIFELFKANDLFGLAMPKECGGMDADMITLCIFCEEMSRVDAGCSNIVQSSWLAAEPILIAGSPEQKKRYLTPLARGDGMFAFGLTERNAGSDVSAMGSTARLQGDKYILNGSKQFKTPIASLQAIQFMLADMVIQIEAARAMVYRSASAIDNKVLNASHLSAIAKTFASDTAMRVTTDAVQIMGGYGYMKEQPVERMMRDAKITQIYEGTNQIQRVVISRALLA